MPKDVFSRARTRTKRLRQLLPILAAGLLAVEGRPAAPVVDAPPAPTPADLPFRVPPGFVAERVAGPPLVEFPMFAAFDDRGRLYVVDSAGVNREP